MAQEGQAEFERLGNGYEAARCLTNLAIALTGAVGDEPEEDVTRWTISRMKLPHRKD